MNLIFACKWKAVLGNHLLFISNTVSYLRWAFDYLNRWDVSVNADQGCQNHFRSRYTGKVKVVYQRPHSPILFWHQWYWWYLFCVTLCVVLQLTRPFCSLLALTSTDNSHMHVKTGCTFKSWYKRERASEYIELCLIRHRPQTLLDNKQHYQRERQCASMCSHVSVRACVCLCVCNCGCVCVKVKKTEQERGVFSKREGENVKERDSEWHVNARQTAVPGGGTQLSVWWSCPGLNPPGEPQALLSWLDFSPVCVCVCVCVCMCVSICMCVAMHARVCVGSTILYIFYVHVQCIQCACGRRYSQVQNYWHPWWKWAKKKRCIK